MKQKELVNMGRDFLLHKIPDGRNREAADRKIKLCRFTTSGIILSILLISTPLYAETGTASYYTRASCLREGTSGICANGEVLNDNDYTAASWFYRFGTVLLVTNLSNGKQVRARVTDRGPAKRLVKKGRIIDLSYAAMSELGGISQGIIKVRVEKI
jgi:rare lipoprotein A